MAYVIQGRKCGSVRVEPDSGTIQSEQVNMTAKVTQYPVEDGSTISDHVVNDPVKFSISGVLVGGDSELNTLKRMREGRDLITYAGRQRFGNLVISSLSYTAKSDNAKGYDIKIQFQQVTITSAQYVATGAVPMSQQQSGKGQTQSTSKEGLQSSYTSAYSAQIGTSGKPTPSSSPSQHGSSSYNGLSQSAQ